MNEPDWFSDEQPILSRSTTNHHHQPTDRPQVFDLGAKGEDAARKVAEVSDFYSVSIHTQAEGLELGGQRA